MLDLKFDHSKKDTAEAMGITMLDMKKFMLDVEDYMQKGKHNDRTHALEFVWASDQSFEMKILTTFTLGALTGNSLPTIIQGKMSELPEELQRILKRLMD
jgi:hypothetical protein